jgi:hypothetical protein
MIREARASANRHEGTSLGGFINGGSKEVNCIIVPVSHKAGDSRVFALGRSEVMETIAGVRVGGGGDCTIRM